MSEYVEEGCYYLGSFLVTLHSVMLYIPVVCSAFSCLLCAALGEISFTGDTPMVTGDTVDVQFLLQGCASVTCSLTRGSTVLPPQDCKWIAVALLCFCPRWCANYFVPLGSFF